jgi:hypothetical protein
MQQACAFNHQKKMHKYAGSAICDFSGGMQHGAVSFDVWMDCQPFFFCFTFVCVATVGVQFVLY